MSARVWLVCRVEVNAHVTVSTVIEVWDNETSALTRMNQLATEDAERAAKNVRSGKTRVTSVPNDYRERVTVQKLVVGQVWDKWTSLRDFVVRTHQLRTEVIDRLAEIGERS